MPKCKLRFTVFAGGLLLLGTLPAGAQSSAWDGSYVANETCYCSGSRSPEIDSQIVPTPIGGQSVKQICERIGTGPTLSKANGEFNFTVYSDPQCGHGPFPAGVSVKDGVELGPEWDLVSLYSPANNAQAVSPGVSDTPVLTSGPRYIVPKKSPAANSSNNSAAIESVAEPVSEQSIVVAEPVAVAKSTAVNQTVKAPVVNSEPSSSEPVSNESLMARLKAKMQVARERARAKELESQRAASELAKKTEAEKEDAAVTATSETPLAVDEQVKPADEEAVAESGSVESKQKDLETALDVAKESESANAPILAALKLPNQVRGSSREFNFVQAQPVNFDFGGAGLGLAISASSHNRIQYFFEASVADTYREVRGGMGYYITPAKADRLTFLFNLGAEKGQFEFSGSGVTTNHTDSGVFVGASSRLVVNNKFELQAGVGYSSFYEGDAKAFGAALFHLNKDVDLTGNVKLGDNDSVGFGVRFYY